MASRSSAPRDVEDPPADGLLAGVRVLDLSIWRPGPYATQLLAELGADVIKVEPPGGDPMRAYAGLFASLHADKRSVEVDLKSETGRRRVLDLARDADVVIEGFRPGVAARLGVGWDDVRAVQPSIVYCSVSGLGQDGPLAQAPGHDLNYVAWSGALAPEGGPPVTPAVPVADLSGGLAAAFAICAALLRCARTGEGERIDVSMTSVLATWTGAVAPRADEVEAERTRTSSTSTTRGVAGYGTFRTSDGGWIALGVLTEDHFWAPLCRALGLDDAAGLGFVDRTARLDELRERLAVAIAARGRDELVADLLDAGVPAAPVLSRDEMVELEHLRVQQAVTAHPWADPATGYPVRLQHHPAARHRPPPALDEHHDARWRDRP